VRNGFIVVAALAASALVGLPGRADAWGKKGHELVGKIADKHLTSKARNAIEELLLNHQFTSLSDGRLTNWADFIKGSATYRRKFPDMNQWHYVDVDVDADLEKIDFANLPQKVNALTALKKWQAVLKDVEKPTTDRREALFFIAHIVGDLAQPLHCATRDNDHGGNKVKVLLPGNDRHETNLHAIWDTLLVDEAVGALTLADYATRLTNTLSTEKRKEYQKGTLKDWIIDGNKVAREKAYKDKGEELPRKSAQWPVKLSDDYVSDRAEVVEVQLTKGGVRLAQFLNDTFKD